MAEAVITLKVSLEHQFSILVPEDQQNMPLGQMDYFELKATEEQYKGRLCPAPICLKAGYKFVKMYPLSPLYQEGQKLIMRQLETLMSPEKAPEESG